MPYTYISMFNCEVLLTARFATLEKQILISGEL